jgi:hypothetical protein
MVAERGQPRAPRHLEAACVDPGSAPRDGFLSAYSSTATGCPGDAVRRPSGQGSGAGWSLRPGNLRPETEIIDCESLSLETRNNEVFEPISAKSKPPRGRRPTVLGELNCPSYP